ncbi:MAG: SAM-dependent methyltransferase [Chloroflexi bacterium RBG_13_53_26]|nr:MAG: SAM-dependent methyltransferase [Chloroflexi bacterium RBG_13_53_26]
MYQWNAKEYESNSSNQKKWAMELLSKLDLRESDRVLDIGCGDGEITALIARRVSKGFAVGIDSSSDMVELARNCYPLAKYPNLSFLLRDATAIDFPERFNAVFSNACLHWVTDHMPVLEGIRRSLKPSGRMLLQMGGRGNAVLILQTLDGIMKEDKWLGFFRDFAFPYGFYGPEEYCRWLEDLGFRIVRVELVPKDMVHEGKKELAAWIRTTWLPYTQRVPELLREEFVMEVVDRYCEEHPSGTDGGIHVSMVRLEVEAEKDRA